MEFTSEDKKKMAIAAIIISISVILTIINVIFNMNSTSTNKIAKDLGKKYYENSLYNSFSANGTSILNLLNDNGYKVNLETLISDNPEYEQYFTNGKKNCDLEKSYIVIYPERPYKSGNYKIKTYLDCE